MSLPLSWWVGMVGSVLLILAVMYMLWRQNRD